MKKVLYISYDGLLDPLGGSQILPYISEIASYNKILYVVSFEKKRTLISEGAILDNKLRKNGIVWRPLIFSSNFGAFGKIFDFIKMHFVCIRLSFTQNIDIVHSRSHLAAQTGLIIKFLFRASLIFDFRGLWVDERVDKGGWNLKFFSHKCQFKIFKYIEKQLLKYSDHIVVLTEAVVDEVCFLGNIERSKITVIPCCADFRHFKPLKDSAIHELKAKYLIPQESIVLGYLGSIGKIYMIDRLFKLIEICLSKGLSVHAIIITKDLEKLNTMIPQDILPYIFITSASRKEVPEKINLMDLMISFTQPSYARMSMSPTKIGECLAVGRPVIVNDGIGDTSAQIKEVNGGLSLEDASDNSLKYIASNLSGITELKGNKLRQRSKKIFSLDRANALYKAIYLSL
jgi:glycosyltransferase involved in cell wall biosynthesis